MMGAEMVRETTDMADNPRKFYHLFSTVTEIIITRIVPD